MTGEPGIRFSFKVVLRLIYHVVAGLLCLYNFPNPMETENLILIKHPLSETVFFLIVSVSKGGEHCWESDVLVTLQGHDSFLLVIKEPGYIIWHLVVDGIEPRGKKIQKQQLRLSQARACFDSGLLHCQIIGTNFVKYPFLRAYFGLSFVQMLLCWLESFLFLKKT